MFNRKMTLLLTLVISLAFSLSLFSDAAFAVDPDIPTITPYVNDFADVIDPQTESGIEAYCAQLEQEMTVELAVLTVDTTYDMSIEEYAVRVFEKNGIGKEENDNGLLIVVAVQDRKWRIEVGYGLEGTINDAMAGRIGRQYMVENFQAERYGPGIQQAVEALGAVVRGDESVIADTTGSGDEMLFVFIVFFVILILFSMVFIAAFTFRRQNHLSVCPKCGGKMKTVYERDRVCYVCTRCKYKRCVKRRKDRFIFMPVPSGSRGGGWSGGGGGGGFGGGGSGGGGASGGW